MKKGGKNNESIIKQKMQGQLPIQVIISQCVTLWRAYVYLIFSLAVNVRMLRACYTVCSPV